MCLISKPGIAGLTILITFASLVCARADVVISTKLTENMSCSGGVCSATAKKAVLNVGDLTDMLADGDTTVESGIAKSIEIDESLSWTNPSRLTLDAERSITAKKNSDGGGGWRADD